MDRFEKNINSKLSDFKAEPPAHLWGNIEARLDMSEAGSSTKLYKQAIGIAAAVFLLMVSAAVLYFNPLDYETSKIADERKTETPARLPEQEAITPITEEREDLQLEEVQRSEEFRQVEQPLYADHQPAASTAEQQSQTIAKTSEILAEDTREIISPSFDWMDLRRIAALSAQLPQADLAIASAEQMSPEITPSVEEDMDVDPQYASNIVFPGINDINDRSAFAFSAFFSPQQAYRHQMNLSPGSMQSLESELLTFNMGLNAHYAINHKWEISSGIAYNRLGQMVNDIASFSHPSMMPLYSSDGKSISDHPQSMSTSMGGIVFTDQSLYFADKSSNRISTLKGSYDESIVNLLNKTGSNLIQHFEYLEIPVTASYKIYQRDFTLKIRAGVSAGYLLSSNVYLQGGAKGEPIGESVGVNTLNFAATAGFSVSYPITERISVDLQPSASTFLTPVGQIKNLSSTTYPYTLSVGIGMSYDL